VNALLKEVDLRKSYLNTETVNTIYFGGGTPSLLSADEINKIIEYLRANFKIDKDVEITLEANPDDLDKATLNNIKQSTAINRLSIGIQSFFDDDLKYLNRVHNGKNAIDAIENSIHAGFENLTIDLIYGTPGLTNEKWKENLKIFFDFKIKHLSSYSLTVEPKTALKTLINKHKLPNVNEDESIIHFKILMEEANKQGFVHYEISNFAKQGYFSKHNSIYWLGGHYIGFGPSAHSFNGKSRQWNISNMKQYIESETVENIILEKEQLSINQQYNEYVMTSLRTSWGCNTIHIENIFGAKYVNLFTNSAKEFITQNSINKNGSIYCLTDRGKLFADGIASEFFVF